MADSRRTFRFQLDENSGVPVYRQIMDQVRGAIALGALHPGDQLPTVRQLAVDLAINPNTVVRAYRELELGGLLESNQGTGTFIREQQVEGSKQERARQLTQLVRECVARAGAAGFTVQEVMAELRDVSQESARRRQV
jgi:GntR family transcriptional regulator